MRGKYLARSAGFSLIELMVGIIVSLISTLAIMAAFSVFEGQKRSTSAGDDAQQNGSYALYTLERQIRSGGSGLIQGKSYGIWGCGINAVTGGGPQLPSAQPAPFVSWPATTRAMSVLVSSGGTNAAGAVQPDIIGIISGDPSGRVFKAPISTTPDNLSVVLTNSFGIYKNDYLLGTLTNGSCNLVQAQTAPVANSIPFASGNSAGTGLLTATNAFDLGPDPVMSLYGVDPTSNSMVMWDLLRRAVNGQPTTAPTPIADGIVMVKALYGVHDGSGTGGAGGDSVDAWVQPTGATWGITAINSTPATAAKAMANIQAVRVAVVAQSNIAERSTDYSRPTALTLFSDLPVAQQYVITVDPRYRYKVYDTTIPVRNAFISKYF